MQLQLRFIMWYDTCATSSAFALFHEYRVTDYMLERRSNGIPICLCVESSVETMSRLTIIWLRQRHTVQCLACSTYDMPCDVMPWSASASTCTSIHSTLHRVGEAWKTLLCTVLRLRWILYTALLSSPALSYDKTRQDDVLLQSSLLL